MKRLYVKLLRSSILIFSFFFFQESGVCQKKVKIDKKTRVIEYYVLSPKENAGFFRRNCELPRMLLEAALKNQIITYQLSDNYGKEEQITTEELAVQLKKLDDTNQEDIYHPDEVSLIGIDLTEGYKEEEVYRQYNFLHLYVPYYHSVSNKNLYVCSFRFPEAMDLLDNQGILWYPESFGLANGIFTNYGGFTMQQTTWAKNLLEDIKKGYLNATFSQSINISQYNAYDGYAVDVHIEETRDKRSFIPDSLELHKALSEIANGADSYICSVSFEDFRSYLKHSTNNIYFLSEAILSRRLTSPTKTWRNEFENFYDSNFKDREVITENGIFIDGGGIDLLSSGNKLKINKIKDHQIGNRNFKLHQVELLDLRRPENEALRGADNELTQLVIDEALVGTLPIYLNDSLRSRMPLTTFKSNIEQQGSDKMTLIELVYELKFEGNGENKSYRPLGLGILTPGEHPKPLGYFRFQDLNMVLTEEEGADVENNYPEILLNRDFKSFIKSNSHISVAERP